MSLLERWPQRIVVVAVACYTQHRVVRAAAASVVKSVRPMSQILLILPGFILRPLHCELGMHQCTLWKAVKASGSTLPLHYSALVIHPQAVPAADM